MSALEKLLEKAGRPFGPGKPLHRFHALFEAADTFALTPSSVTRGATHVRDALDLKRMMTLVIIAMLPCIFMAMYNTGLQANLGIDPAKVAALEGWRHDVMRLVGVGYSPESFWACLFHGSLYFLPLYIVTMVVGITWEVLFAIVRRHEVNEGFFVTGMIFPLICPPDAAAVGGRARHQLRRGGGQGSVRRHGHELHQPGARGARLRLLRLSRRHFRRPGVGGGRPGRGGRRLLRCHAPRADAHDDHPVRAAGLLVVDSLHRPREGQPRRDLRGSPASSAPSSSS